MTISATLGTATTRSDARADKPVPMLNALTRKLSMLRAIGDEALADLELLIDDFEWGRAVRSCASGMMSCGTPAAKAWAVVPMPP